MSVSLCLASLRREYIKWEGRHRWASVDMCGDGLKDRRATYSCFYYSLSDSEEKRVSELHHSPMVLR